MSAEMYLKERFVVLVGLLLIGFEDGSLPGISATRMGPGGQKKRH